MENPDDPKQIEHDPDETAPNRRCDYSVSPSYVISIIAVMVALQVQNHGLHSQGAWDWIALGAFCLFCLWNYWPRR